MRFKVMLWEEVGGYAFIEATDCEEAKKKAQQILDNDGVEGFNKFESTHRDTSVIGVE
jgi:hypothetical protein